MNSTILIAFAIIIGVLLIDQGSKALAKRLLINPLTKEKKSIHIVKDYYYLTYIENSGMAMGRYSGKYLYFYIATFISLFVFSYLAIYMDIKSAIGFTISLSLLIGGTVGNLIDRVLRGYVIDFITGRIFKHHLPVYNIADVSIFIGGIGTILFAILEV